MTAASKAPAVSGVRRDAEQLQAFPDREHRREIGAARVEGGASRRSADASLCDHYAELEASGLFCNRR